jgi:hypothetical protein
MTSKGRVVAMLVTFALLGCKGVQPTSAASGTSGEPGGDGGVAAVAASSDGIRVEMIKDPTLGMDAIPVGIPADWHFEGSILQPGNCVQSPTPVWRASSPDGHSFMEHMPVMAWVWGTGPMVGFTPKEGCLPMHGAMTAEDFAKYMAGTLHVQYVEDVPIPQQERAAMQNDAQQRRQRLDAAMMSVRWMLGSTPMKGMMRVVLRCTETNTPGQRQAAPWAGPGHPLPTGFVMTDPSTVNHCESNVLYMTGPESQFAGLLRQWSAPKMGSGAGTEEWQNAWTQRTQQRVARDTQVLINGSNARFQAEQDGYRRAAAVQQRMHNEFMDTMARGTADSMARTQDAMNARSTAASDWVDYSLDRKTILDTNTGALYKTSNQITPGGAAVQVHGDGTPIH